MQKKTEAKFTKEKANGFLSEENKSRWEYRDITFLQRVQNTYQEKI